MDYTRARELYRCSLQIEQESRNERGAAVALFNLGCVALAVGKYDEARRLFAESLAGFPAAGNAWEGGFPLNGLPLIALASGDLAQAHQHASDSLSVRAEAKDPRGLAESQRSLAWVAIIRGKSKKAKELLSESMKACRGIGDKRGIAETLELFALLCFHSQAFNSATALYAAFEYMREGFTYSLPKFRIEQRHAARSRLRDLLGEPDYDNAWRQVTRCLCPPRLRWLCAQNRNPTKMPQPVVGGFGVKMPAYRKLSNKACPVPEIGRRAAI